MRQGAPSSGACGRVSWLAALAFMVSSCSYLPDWMGGTEGGAHPIKTAEADKRLPVVAEEALIQPDADTLGATLDLPEQASNASWLNPNDAMRAGHLGMTGLKEAASATVGEGASYAEGLVPTPVISGGVVYAMDGEGVISAHDTKDPQARRWVSDALVEEDEPAIIGGGLTLHEGVLYAVTGFGRLAALDAATGKQRWSVKLGVPVRGAPVAEGAVLVVLTVDNQTLAFDTSSGQARWTHRGIRETAGYLSATSPVISDGLVLSAYSSGELVAQRLENGEVLWSDALINAERTRASDVFTGIDADPVVMDSVVYAVSTSGIMVANALLNGRTLWQQRIDGHDTPWAAGNALFMLTSAHQLVALNRGNGKVLWAQNLGRKDGLRDVTPALFGPVLAGNAVIVVTGDGELLTFRPGDGKKLGAYEIADDVAAPPVIAEGTLYLVTRSASLLAYR